MHHKRRRPKNRRAGCLMCKPHKHQRAKDTKDAQTIQELKARIEDREVLTCYNYVGTTSK